MERIRTTEDTVSFYLIGFMVFILYIIIIILAIPVKGWEYTKRIFGGNDDKNDEKTE